jgi:hypothetical protein
MTANIPLTPELTEVIRDAIFMFKDIEKARELPPYADVQKQYVAMGRLLEALLKAAIEGA